MALNQSSSPLLQPPLSVRDHIVGPTAAIVELVELVEYGDFECPHCARLAIIIRQLRADLGDQLRFAYRHFPLAKMHPHARKAAEASEAAATHGKFWEMHDTLFEHSRALESADLIIYAQALDLDIVQFQSDLANDVYAGRVQEDVISGIRSGVNGTPTFFLNGKRYNGGYDYDSLAGAIGI